MTNRQMRTILERPEENTVDNYIIAINHYIEIPYVSASPEAVRKAMKFMFDQLYVVTERKKEKREGKIKPYSKQAGIKWYKGVKYIRNEQGNWVAEQNNSTSEQ